MQFSQTVPVLASTACINRRFEDCSVAELETEMKMFTNELQNALWIKPSNAKEGLYAKEMILSSQTGLLTGGCCPPLHSLTN